VNGLAEPLAIGFAEPISRRGLRRVASLPMYDFPELRAATDAWWSGLAAAFRRQGLRGVPRQLSRVSACNAEWSRRDLLFSQCCGYDLVLGAAGALQVIATPVYDWPYCGGPNYRSVVVVREDEPAQSLADLRGRVCAVNMTGSHSGYNVMRAMIAPLAGGGRFFGEVFESGSHRASLAMVAEGRADLAAIDCVTFGIARRLDLPGVSRLRVMAESPAVPGLPLITGAGTSAEELGRLRVGLAEALADPKLEQARAALGLAGAAWVEPTAYRVIAEMAERAEAAGYPVVI
jgi:ABC-type phosphate/phosphonate transport system substrate-binding protein